MMKSLWAGITNLIDPTRQSFMIFLFTFESCDRGGGVRTRPKSTIRLSHHIRLVPHPTALSRWLCCHFSLAKILSNYHKKSQITYTRNHFSVVALWNHPLFQIWLCRYSWLKKPLKRGKKAELIGSIWSGPHPGTFCQSHTSPKSRMWFL